TIPSLDAIIRGFTRSTFGRQHFLNFFPLPQLHGSFRPSFPGPFLTFNLLFIVLECRSSIGFHNTAFGSFDVPNSAKRAVIAAVRSYSFVASFPRFPIIPPTTFRRFPFSSFGYFELEGFTRSRTEPSRYCFGFEIEMCSDRNPVRLGAPCTISPLRATAAERSTSSLVVSKCPAE